MVKKSLYDFGLNGQGYLAVGTPDKINRSMGKAPTYGETPQNIDLDYNDASHLLAWAQTDWSMGYQDEIWSNNGKYRYGENIDPLKEYGKARLLNNLYEIFSLAAGQSYASSAIFNQKLYIGTLHASLAKLYSLDDDDNETALTTGWSAINKVNSMDECNGSLVLGLSRASGVEHTIQKYSGSAFSNANNTTYDTVRMIKSVGTRCYAGVYVSAASGDRLIYTDNIEEATPTWTTRQASFGKNKQIIKAVDYYGILYFLVQDYPGLELWMEDGSDIERVYRWDNLINPDIVIHDQYVFISGQTDSSTYVYGWNGAQLIPMFEEKEEIAQSLDSRYMVSWKGDLWTQGLRYDGKYWYTGLKKKYGDNNIRPFSVFGFGAAYIYYFGVDGSTTKILRTDFDSYFTQGYIESGIWSEKPAINKLWVSCDITFEPLATGESFEVQYSIDFGANWTSLGTASTVGSTSKTFYFTEDTSSKFIMYRVYLNSGGTSTPVLKDITFRYKLLVNQKHAWSLALHCAKDIQLKDGISTEIETSENLRNKLLTAFWNNQIVDFEDVDYWECSLVGNHTAAATIITVNSVPSDAPENGWFKIDNEIISYTGKTRTTYTGCTRGARGTIAATHTSGATVSNLWKVLIIDYNENSPVLNSALLREYIVRVTLLEI
jgi:hypothetical protein